MADKQQNQRSLRPVFLLIWIAIVALFFAQVEIQIEGPKGWAEDLPTWRIEEHWLLDIFWGSRPLTGYHAWAFSFMALVFHLPLIMFGTWSLRHEARVLGSLMLFWIIEDFLWFVLNPAYGAMKLFRGEVAWHKHYALFLPVDYWVFAIIGSLLLWYSFRSPRHSL